MTKNITTPVLQLIHRLVEDPRVQRMTDRELLGRFRTNRDEPAFQGLVRRHGAMVLEVCRNVLGNEADAEDAFQATFLVLAQKVAAIRKEASVGSWLYGVAYRIAVTAQRKSAKRQKHETRRADQTPAATTDDLTWREVQQVLYDELNRISKYYQAPLVLCYLEGKTQDEAAVVLGISKATVKKRLERGRALLRVRLVRRGLGPVAVLVAAAWPLATASAKPGPALVYSTVKAATLMAAGQAAAAGLVSTKVMALTEGVLKAMFVSKVRAATVILLAVAVAGSVTGALTYRMLAAGRPGVDTELPLLAQQALPKAPPEAVNKEQAKVEDKQATTQTNKADAKPRKQHSVSGIVRDSSGKLVAGANVYWLAQFQRRTRATLPKNGLPSRIELELLQTGKTDDQGRFSLQAQFEVEDRRVADRMTILVAKAPKNGFGGMRYGLSTKKVELNLAEEVPIEGRLLAPNGSPAKGVLIRMHISRRTTSIIPEEGWGIQSPVMWQGKEYKIPDFPEPVVTDEKGRFTLDGLVQGGEVAIETSHDNFAPEELQIASNSKLTEWLVKSFGQSDALQPKFTHTLAPARPVQGVITDKDTGRPLADVLVEITIWRVQNGAHGGQSYYARTDAQGRYRLSGPLPNDSFMAYSFAVHPSPESGYLPVEDNVNHPLPVGQKSVEKSFALPKGIMLRGRIIDRDTKNPIEGAAIVYEPKLGNPNNRGNLQFYNHPASSDEHGNFSVTGLRGEGFLLVEGPSADYVRFSLTREETKSARERFLHGYAKLHMKDQGEPAPVEISLHKGVTVEVQAVKPDGQPLPWVSALCRGIGPNVNWVHGIWHPEGCDKGRLRLTGLDPARTYRIFLIHAESRLAAVAEIRVNPEATQPIEVRLQPTGKVRGKVINPDGTPAAQCGVQPHMLLTEDNDPVTRDDLIFGDRVISQVNFEQRMIHSLARWRANDKGEFEFDSLMPGVRLVLQAGTSDNKEAMKEVTLKPGESRDIGTLTLEKRKE